jgi:antitoxin CptB
MDATSVPDFAALDERRRRLRYRLWHRGTREMDLIMGRFVDAVIVELSEHDIDDLERLAEVPDPELYAWVSSGSSVPCEYDGAMFRRLRAFHFPETTPTSVSNSPGSPA